MTFVTTWLAVAGAAAMAIPIIIHLIFRQRRRPIEWAAMRFLIEAFRKQKRRLQLEQILLLAVRCMIVLVLGLALARPILRGAGLLDDDGFRTVILVIDDGLASQVTSEPSSPETAFARHIEQARELVSALGESEAVGIITAARPATGRIVPPSVDHGAVLEFLDALHPTLAPTDIPASLELARRAAEEATADGGSATVIVLSEFREGSALLETALPSFAPLEEIGGGVRLLASQPATDAVGNVQVAAVTPVRRVIVPDASDAAQQITVHLSRHGGELSRASNRVRLRGDSSDLAPAKTIEWTAGQTTLSETFSIAFDSIVPGRIGVSAIVEEQDGMGPDNRQFMTLEVRESLQVALVSPPTFERMSSLGDLTPGQWIRRALHASDDSRIELTDVAPASLDDLDLRSMDVAIITRPDRITDGGWQALRGFVDRGGLVVFVPPTDVNVHQWTERLRDDLSLPWRIALEPVVSEEGLGLADTQPASELFRMLQGELIDITRSLVVYRYLSVVAVETQAEIVLTLENESPLMIMGAPEPPEGEASASADASRGLVVLLATAPLFPEWSTLPVQMFMVPLFQETVRQGVSMIRARDRARVGDRPVLAALPAGITSLRAPSGAEVALDPYRRPVNPLEEQGLYGGATGEEDEGALLAVNIDISAARTETVSAAVIDEWLSGAGEWQFLRADAPASALATSEQASSLAGTLLWALLALVAIETILARRFSHAFRLAAGTELAGGMQSTVSERRGPVAAR
jgi:hypothetical protein